MARTGSGKTAAFLVPLLQKLKSHSLTVGARAVVFSPTRELALQTAKFTRDIGRNTGLRTCLLVGGDSLEDQFTALAQNPDILIVTPGRLLHHLQEVENFNMSLVQYVVFDEADRLFEQGFDEQIREIMKRMPDTRQTVLFSATLPKMLIEFARAGLKDPTMIRLDTDTKLSENLQTAFLSVRAIEKIPALLFLLREQIPPQQQAVVFCATRHNVEFINEVLTAARIDSCCIYGTMDQAARKINLAKFRANKSRVLVVTDVAARGLDIPLLDNVINFDYPPRPKVFIHRVGRVARAGRSGVAYSLVAPDDLGFTLELFLYLGWAPTWTLKEGDDPLHHYLGTIPPAALSEDADWLKTLVSQRIELQQLEKSHHNAYKLYFKTRGVASPNAIARAKDMLDQIKTHPIFAERMAEYETEAINMVNALKFWRPQQVWDS